MGFDIDSFKNTPHEDLICPICFGVLDDPLEDVCGHLFCRPCLDVLNGDLCPMSRQKLRPTRRPNFAIRNILNGLEIKCHGYARCGNYVKLENLETGCGDCFVSRRTSRLNQGFSRNLSSDRPGSQNYSQTQGRRTWISDAIVLVGLAVGIIICVALKR